MKTISLIEFDSIIKRFYRLKIESSGKEDINMVERLFISL